jgi:hypothetical protein
MIIEYERLLYRIRENPIEHLGKRSVSEIDDYFFGYELARDFWRQPKFCRRINFEQFREWLNSKVHLCRQGMPALCLLLTEDEKQAFDLYFELYDNALEECKNNLAIFNQEQLSINSDQTEKSQTLIKFLLEPQIREKLALYFGNHRWISGLWAMCNGFVWSEKDMGIENSSDAMNLELFQFWLNERYPIAKDQTWDKLFYFLALHCEKWALNEFYEHFEMFLEGDLPEALSKTNREILKNMQNQIEKEGEK